MEAGRTADDGRKSRPIAVVARAMASGTSERILSVLPTARMINRAVSENSMPAMATGTAVPSRAPSSVPITQYSWSRREMRTYSRVFVQGSGSSIDVRRAKVSSVTAKIRYGLAHRVPENFVRSDKP